MTKATPEAWAEGAAEGQPGLAQILAQQAALAEIAQRALAEQGLEPLLDETVSLIERVLQTELVSVSQLNDEGGLRVVAGRGWRQGVVGELMLGSETGSQSGFTLTLDEPLIVPDLRQERRFQVVPELLEHGAVSGLSARIGNAEQPFGVLSAWTGRGNRFKREDASFMQAVANVLAGAVERLRVEAQSRHARGELEAIISSVQDGILVRGRDGRLLYANEKAARLNRYPSAQALVAAPPGEVESRFTIYDEDGEPLATERLPSRLALATGRQTPERTVRVVWHASGEERWQILQATPLRAEGTTEKVVVVIRDITEERRASNNRQFLTEALATLSATLDQEEASRSLARLCVPRLGGYCAVDLLDVDGSVVPAALVHVEPEAAALAWRLRGQRPLRPADAGGPARVIREGRPELTQAGSLPPEREGQPADLTSAHMLALGLGSWLSVPLVARGCSIGVLTIGRTVAERPLDQHDLALAQELGARAGIALENARLFETARDRRAELDAVLAAMADAVLVFDASGRLRLTNRAAEQLFEHDPPRTVDRLRERVRRDSDRGAPAGGNGKPAAGASAESLAELEGEVQLAGLGRWFELRRYRSRRTPADRGEKHGPFVVVLRDITDTRAARAARDAFLGVLSHELRTPITTIYGGSELLERTLKPDEREEVVRDIRAESERLARLVEDLLVMTRVERGGVEIGDEPVLMQRLVPSVARSLQGRLPGLRIGLHMQENLPAVRGDPTYLEQVLRNLMTNAVRYGAGLQLGIDVAGEVVDERVHVRVRDHGPGLGEEDPERLFDLFYRSPSALSVPGGAGIGLFVCRRLAEAMGGGIEARSHEEGGSEFTLYLPMIESDVA